MSLIKCPECGHQISEYSDKCIYCGCPMSKIKELISHKDNDDIQFIVNSLVDYITNKNTKLIKINLRNEIIFKKENKKTHYLTIFIKPNGVSVGFRGKHNKHLFSVTKNNLNEIYQKLDEDFFSRRGLYEKRTTMKDPATGLPNFLIGLTSEQKEIISSYELAISKRLTHLKIENKKSTYRFVLMEDDKEIFTICWFTNGLGKEIVFKYHLDLANKKDNVVINPTLDNVEDSVEQAINNIPRLKKQIDEKLILPSYELKNNKSERNQSVDNVYKSIILCLLNKTIKNEEHIDIANKVKDFLIVTTQCPALINPKLINLDFYRRFYVYSLNVHGYCFDLNNVKEENIKVVFNYYKVSCLIDKIKKYEAIYNETIIDNIDAFTKDAYSLIINEDYFFSKANGLTSNFSLIPESSLLEVVESLNKYEN